MTVYTYKEVEKALFVAGFEEVKNNGGSHMMYKNEVTGLSQPMPSHGKELKSGTAESILKFALLSAFAQGIDITDKKYKLSDNVVKFAKKVYGNIRESKKNIIPASIQMQENIQTEQDANNYLTNLIKKSTNYNKDKNSKNNKQSLNKNKSTEYEEREFG